MLILIKNVRAHGLPLRGEATGGVGVARVRFSPSRQKLKA